MQKNNHDDLEKLYQAILLLKDTEECNAFFTDICTTQELYSIAQRLEVAKKLANGDSYIDINKSTGASTATISRVSKYLNFGYNGYKLILERLKKDEAER